ncbi:hypothetical protein ACFYY9_23420 [Streptomyces nigra]|uniref:hypothetical protein n=1 Tax=Streptomyces nigra TaxID=1827580 RepID=UPI0036BF2B22
MKKTPSDSGSSAQAPLWPAASVFMEVDEAGRVLVSFDRTPDATKIGLELPHQSDRLVALYAAVVKAARLMTGAKDDSDAVVQLKQLARKEERERLNPPALVPKPTNTAWRSTPLPDVRRDYPVGRDHDRREMPGGLPDSNRRRH